VNVPTKLKMPKQKIPDQQRSECSDKIENVKQKKYKTKKKFLPINMKEFLNKSKELFSIATTPYVRAGAIVATLDNGKY